MESLLTVQELSKLLKMKPSTLYAWAAQGKIPHFRIYGTLRFKKHAIEEWLRTWEHCLATCRGPSFLKNQDSDHQTKIIAEIRGKSYNFPQGNPGHGHRKEGNHGL